MQIRRGTILIIIGSLILLYVFSSYFLTLRQRHSLVKQFQESIERAEVANVTEANVEAKEGTAPPDTKDAPYYEEDDIIGLLKISNIKLESPIRQSMSMNTLKASLGHYENSVLPGENGNCVIAGHRAYLFGQLFSRLDEVKKTDVIEIQTKECNYRYEVKEISVIEPYDWSMFEATEDSVLTLMTCTPKYSGTHRLIVRAELMK